MPSVFYLAWRICLVVCGLCVVPYLNLVLGYVNLFFWWKFCLQISYFVLFWLLVSSCPLAKEIKKLLFRFVRSHVPSQSTKCLFLLECSCCNHLSPSSNVLFFLDHHSISIAEADWHWVCSRIPLLSESTTAFNFSCPCGAVHGYLRYFLLEENNVA